MQPLQRFTSSALGALLKEQPLSPGKVRFAWTVSVGASIRRVSSVTLRDDGTLLAEVSDARWAPEIKRSASLLLGRLETILGPRVVRRIVVQAPDPDGSHGRRRLAGRRRTDPPGGGSLTRPTTERVGTSERKNPRPRKPKR